jgi:hypothetical protein
MVEIIDYNIYTTPFKDLPCLEDAIQKGYSEEDEQNRTVSIGIRQQPAAIIYAINSLIKQGNSNYFSVIERHAIYYAISALKKDLELIISKRRELEESGSVEDLELLYGTENNLSFLGVIKSSPGHVYMPFWCSEWIHSNSNLLGINTTKFSVFLLLWALNKSTIVNPSVKSEIKKNAEWFTLYINKQKEKFQIE